MRILPRYALPGILRKAGLDPKTRNFPETVTVHQLTVKQREEPPFTGGPHRKVIYPDGRIEGPFPVADRPALSRFLAEAFLEIGVQEVAAAVTDGAFWLNNKTQAAYLHRVADARAVSRFLRTRGLTDRFRGGFGVDRAQFLAILPVLAANTYAGGADVLFVALRPDCHPITALACHHFDLHFAAPSSASIAAVAALAERHGLQAQTIDLVDLPTLWESEIG